MTTSSFHSLATLLFHEHSRERTLILALWGVLLSLLEHLAIDADVDGEPAMLHAKVGQILRIRPIGSNRPILMSLLVLAGIQLCHSKDP
jgi:hypothetical protein